MATIIQNWVATSLDKGTADANASPVALYSLTTYHFCAPSRQTDFYPPTCLILCVKSSAYRVCSALLQNQKF